MQIQPLLFPNNICDEELMYFRCTDKTISLETYFNSFSIGKWKKYTNLKSLYFSVTSPYELSFECINAIGDAPSSKCKTRKLTEEFDINKYVSVKRQSIPFTLTREHNIYKLSFSELPDEGIIYININTQETPNDISKIIQEGGYYTDDDPTYTPHFAIGICTFRREEYLFRNINLLINSVLNNENSPLYNQLELYISDNGQTIDIDKYNNYQTIHIYPNMNAGGAGGFVRCMIESVLYPSHHPFSHIILMDDDILLDPQILERTWYFLSYVSPQYKNAILGGEMFETDRKYMLFESGGQTNWISCDYYHRFWDMRNSDLISTNERIEPINYSGWWYNCIPTELITETNLPFPAFIHFDDIEYGVRHIEHGLILINGICVWHPQGITKNQNSMVYYDMRNSLIAESISSHKCNNILRLWIYFSKHYIYYLVASEYNKVELLLRAYTDFYRGPDEFIKINPSSKHKELSDFNYKYIPLENAGINSPIKIKSSKLTTEMQSIIGLFCLLLPPLFKVKVVLPFKREQPFLYKHLYIYDEEKKAGVLLTKNHKKIFHYLKKYICISKNILFSHKKNAQEWNNAKTKITSLDFWEQYLKLK